MSCLGRSIGGVRAVVGLSAVLGLVSVVGCNDANQATPESAASSSAKAKSSAPRSPVSPMAKVDPQTMKEYRTDVCLFGTYSLRHARDAYLGSLGADEPSEKKIPLFGAPVPPATPAPATPTPAASGSAKGDAKTPAPPATAKPTATPAATAKPTATPAATTAPAASGSAGPAASARPDRKPLDVSLRAPHERNARACTVAAGLKEPAMTDVDAALKDFAPFAQDLAKTIAQAQTYYQREEHKKDNFEKGKEYHKKLKDGFAKLDEQHDKLAKAVAEWRKSHAHDLSKADEGEKLAWTAVDDAREVMLVAVGAFDAEAFKKALEKAEKSAEALKTFAGANATDPWGKIVSPSLEAFVRNAKDAAEKATGKDLPKDNYLQLVTSFTSLVEARHRALSRSLIVKNNPNADKPGMPNRPMPMNPRAMPKREREPGGDPHQH
jgi:hypothetical protein